MSQANLIFRLSGALRDVGLRCGLGNIDRSSRLILEYIGELQADGVPVQVKTVVGSGLFGTAPTVMQKLAHLERDGWIESYADPHDLRARRLALSRQSLKAFSRMSSEVSKVFASNY
jgi:hypothetical protein